MKTEYMMNYVDKYSNCISLGGNCSVACSLSKLGLRNASGPFDWYVSDFSSVLAQIENEFQDFMKRENPEIDIDNPKIFRDKKYDFVCNHDVKVNFEDEYQEIYQKYDRRVRHFQQSIKFPTCFFRAVLSEKELQYIIENEKYIEYVLKKANKKNKIVYVLLNNMQELPKQFTCFKLNIDKYIGKIYEMRTFFNQSNDLVKFCCGLLDINTIETNKLFDKKVNAEMIRNGMVYHYVNDDIDGIDRYIVNYLHLKEKEKFFVWGAGVRGIPLVRYLTKRGVSVTAIIDNNEDVSDKSLAKVPVISFKEVPDSVKIFISVSNKDAIEQIVNQIQSVHTKSKIMTYGDFIGLEAFEI